MLKIRALDLAKCEILTNAVSFYIVSAFSEGLGLAPVYKVGCNFPLQNIDIINIINTCIWCSV